MITRIRAGNARSEDTIPLDHVPAIVGNCDYATIQINDASVAEFHCSLREHNGAMLVRDLGSGKTTEINGYEIRESVVFPGDTITFGSLTFEIDYRRNESGLLENIALRKASIG